MMKRTPTPGPAASGRAVPGPQGAEPSDAELLERFGCDGDESAFEAVVERYGPMVMGACRRVLGDAQEAEDAFQATFLLLVRRARALKRPDLLGNWLYGAALRIARKARARAARRAEREQAVPTTPPPAPDPMLEASWRELCLRLDEELQGLPGKYRAPLVLCYLEGLTNEEAARRLGWPSGSISYRLARGRELLRQRLSRRFPAAPSSLFAIPVIWAANSEVATELVAAVVRLGSALLRGTRDAAAAVAPGTSAAAARSGRVVKLLLAVVPAVVAAALLARAWATGPAPAAPAAAPHNCCSPAASPEGPKGAGPPPEGGPAPSSNR
jgi:RNA polymerase sigma factor (sigma-70 family)